MASSRAPVVLWIEPRPDGHERVTEHLHARGMTVHLLNGTTLSERLARGDVDLLVCDTDLTGLSPDQLQAAAAELAGTGLLPPELLLLTRYAELTERASHLAGPHCQLVATPVRLPELEQAIDRAVECRNLRERVRQLESSRREVVLRSVEDLTSRLGLEGTLTSVLRAAELLIKPHAAAVWLADSPDGCLNAVAVLPHGSEAQLHDGQAAIAEDCFRGGAPLWRTVEPLQVVALPIAIDGDVEGVLSASFDRSAALLDGPDSHRVLDALADHAARAVTKERLYADLERSSAKVDSLFRVGLAMSSETSLQQLFQVVVDSAAEVCSASRCSLMLVAEDRTTLQMRAARGIPEEVVKVATANVGEGICGGVAASGKALLVSDIERDRRFGLKNRSQYANNSLISVPILVNDRVVGVLNVNDKLDGSSFDANDLKLVVLLANQAAVAIDNAARYEDLSEKAVTDGLTGVYIRRYFDEALERAFRSARTTGRSFAVLMCDLDRFKSINDSHGHQVGDEALRAVAQALRAAVRDEDNVSRYGGEEFAIILARAELKTAMQVAERIRAAVEATPVSAPGGPLRLTISIGVSAFDETFEQAAQIVAAADKALYRAKETGRNRVLSAL